MLAMADLHETLASADANVLGRSNCKSSFSPCLRAPRCKHAQTMTIRIERDEGSTEVHLCRCLRDLKTALSPICVGRIYCLGVGDCERDFAGARLGGGGRFEQLRATTIRA